MKDHNENWVGVDIEDERGPWMSSYTGRRFHPLAPRREDVATEDVLRGLAFTRRFAGQTRKFYSVAEHSVLGSVLAEDMGGRPLARQFLLHDATEAWIGDMPRPLKYEMARFREVEARIWNVVADRYRLPRRLDDRVKQIDNIMCVTEKLALMPHAENWPSLPDSLADSSITIEAWPPSTALRRIARRFRELFPDERFILHED